MEIDIQATLQNYQHHMEIAGNYSDEDKAQYMRYAESDYAFIPLEYLVFKSPRPTMNEITIIGNYEAAIEIVTFSLAASTPGSLAIRAKIERISSYLNEQVQKNLTAIEQS
jgi:hypothetical protein